MLVTEVDAWASAVFIEVCNELAWAAATARLLLLVAAANALAMLCAVACASQSPCIWHAGTVRKQNAESRVQAYGI